MAVFRQLLQISLLPFRGIRAGIHGLDRAMIAGMALMRRRDLGRRWFLTLLNLTKHGARLAPLAAIFIIPLGAMVAYGPVPAVLYGMLLIFVMHFGRACAAVSLDPIKIRLYLYRLYTHDILMLIGRRLEDGQWFALEQGRPYWFCTPSSHAQLGIANIVDKLPITERNRLFLFGEALNGWIPVIGRKDQRVFFTYASPEAIVLMKQGAGPLFGGPLEWSARL